MLGGTCLKGIWWLSEGGRVHVGKVAGKLGGSGGLGGGNGGTVGIGGGLFI